MPDLASLPDFPDANTGAIGVLASSLQTITFTLAGIGIETKGLRDAVIQNEQWQGDAAQQWQAVVTDRIGDAGLTNDVMGTASSLLSQLASDLDGETQTYNHLYTQFLDSLPPAEREPTVAQGDPQLYNAIVASVGRANDLLNNAGRTLLSLAVLAGDIHAQPASNRTPGVPSGTNRNTASLQLLAFLFGSVTDNQTIGSTFEKWMLSKLGFPKNTEVWRPDPGFEGKLDPKGTIVDAKGIISLPSSRIRKTYSIAIKYVRRSRRRTLKANRCGSSQKSAREVKSHLP